MVFRESGENVYSLNTGSHAIAGSATASSSRSSRHSTRWLSVRLTIAQPCVEQELNILSEG
jgi:hypothetical protein